MGTEVGASCNARSRSFVDQRLGPPPMMMFMALLMTLSWRFRLILGPERARWRGRGDVRGDTPTAVSHPDGSPQGTGGRRGDPAPARVSRSDGSPRGTRGRRRDISARIGPSAVTPQGAGGRRGGQGPARVGRPDGSPRGARGGRGGDLSVRVSHPAVTPR